eukprot:scaffold6303_cov37-Prasinocladus_malaysianus.AAC.1
MVGVIGYAQADAGKAEDDPSETASPAGSWSSVQREEHKEGPSKVLQAKAEELQRPNKLEDPETGNWVFYDDTGREALHHIYLYLYLMAARVLKGVCGTMEEMRQRARQGELPLGASIYRKEDGIWLPLQYEALPKLTYQHQCQNGRGVSIPLDVWFENTASNAARHMSHKPGPLPQLDLPNNGSLES